MYKDPYNNAVSSEIQSRVRRHAANIDRLNGSGKAKNEKVTGGAAMCPANYDPVTDPETGREYSNKCKMAAAKRGGAKERSPSPCCARCRSCNCKKMRGGAADTPIAASKWYKAQDEDFKDTIAQTITPTSVRENRMKNDLGAGKYGMKGAANFVDMPDNSRVVAQSNLVSPGLSAKNVSSRGKGVPRGIRGCGNVTPQGLTPPSVARTRMKLDLGAGKFQGGARKKERLGFRNPDHKYIDLTSLCKSQGYSGKGKEESSEEHYENDELVGGAAEHDEDEDYEDGDDCGEMEGGAADYDEPESLKEMKSICDDYEQQKLTGGAMTKRIRAMLPHGKKSMSASLSKLLRQLKKRGRASFARRLKLGMMTPAIMGQKHSEGSGRYVGGSKDHGEIEKIHASIFGGSKLSGGYGPVAPTTEALAGYDNRDQPKGLKPPPSVNQQPSMRGGAVPLHSAYPVAPAPTSRGKGTAGRKAVMPVMGQGASGGRTYSDHALIPVAQLPSKIGGGKGGVRRAANGDYYGPSTGAIIPNLQSAAAPAGSGKRGSRGAMVAKLMKEKGMTLGEASKALKGGAYTANDFFMPKNIHQFFGAYA